MAPTQQFRSNYNSSRVAAGSAAEEGIQEQILWKLVVITALAYLLWSDKISIVLGPVSDENTVSTSQAVRASFLDMAVAQHPQRSQKTDIHIELAPGTLNNTTFAIDPAYAKRNRIDREEVAVRESKCRDYVERFAPIAMAEMRKFGIPASIILAQGLLESDAGESRLSQTTNNHFGMKCFSKQCKKGHCANFSDDSHKDFFVKYGNAWSSFRDHSEFLKKTKRYRSLFQFEPGDYKNWAIGLEQSGYATDKQYAEKLMALIHSLGLHRYDGA